MSGSIWVPCSQLITIALRRNREPDCMGRIAVIFLSILSFPENNASRPELITELMRFKLQGSCRLKGRNRFRREQDYLLPGRADSN